MRDKKEFFNILNGIDGESFTEYAKLTGDFDFSRYVLKINQVQENIFDKGTLFVIRVPQIIASFPPHLFNSPVRRTALEDYLTRKVAAEIDRLARYDEQGVSKRRLSIAVPGQKILPRTALLVSEEFVEARIYVSLPCRGDKVFSEAAKDVFFEDLPSVVNGALIYCNLDEGEVREFVDQMEDADHIRQVIPTQGLVSFLSEGSAVARLGNTDYPDYENTQLLTIPDELMVEVDTPNFGVIRGFGIPRGITLILGDAYSGRIDILKAISHGIYNHVPGDGRESVVTVPDAVYISAEEGRSVQRMNLSPFVQALPNGTQAKEYTNIASDSCASQAAATIEALEVGARVLLFDESDSSAAFLSRDSRLSGLLPGAEERVLPLSARIRQIVDDLGVSVVVGGSSSVSEFIPVADKILRVDGYKVYDITEEAKKLAISVVNIDKEEVADLVGIGEKTRWIVPSSIDPSSGQQDALIHAASVDILEFGRSTIDLRAVSQLADIYQTETIGRILYYAKLHYMDEGRPIREVLDLVDRDLSTEGLECLTRDLRGDLARPRRYEIAAALNRLDTLRISHTVD